MDEVVKLDRKSFEALAGKTRVKALKALLERRKTLTELSEELGLSPSTIKEHMEVLEGAGLVVQVDEGRKWKYYELTRKGENVARPKEVRAIIMLAGSLFILGVALLNLFMAFSLPGVQMEGGMAAAPAPAAETGAERVYGEVAEEAVPSAAEDEAAPAGEAVPSAAEPEAGEKAVAAGDEEGMGAEAPFPAFELGIVVVALLLVFGAFHYAKEMKAV